MILLGHYLRRFEPWRLLMSTWFWLLWGCPLQAEVVHPKSSFEIYKSWQKSVPASMRPSMAELPSPDLADHTEIHRMLLQLEKELDAKDDFLNLTGVDRIEMAVKALPDTHALQWYFLFYTSFYELACGDMRRAVLLADLSLQWSEKQGHPPFRLSSLWLLFALNKERGDYASALGHLESFQTLYAQFERQLNASLLSEQQKVARPARTGLMLWWFACVAVLMFVGWYFWPYRGVFLAPARHSDFTMGMPAAWLDDTQQKQVVKEGHVLTDEEIVVDEAKVEMLAQLRSHKMITQDDWEAFEVLFNRIYPDFLIHLRFKHKGVTPAEEKLACLIRAHFSTKEIARVLGVSTHSVNVGRHRLKKRCGLDNGQTLEEYLMRF